jgi:hypothetical protein
MERPYKKYPKPYRGSFLMNGGGDETCEEGMCSRWLRLVLGVELCANKPRVIVEFEDFDE